mgnify:CR=1 FL=1
MQLLSDAVGEDVSQKDESSLKKICDRRNINTDNKNKHEIKTTFDLNPLGLMPEDEINFHFESVGFHHLLSHIEYLQGIQA